MLLPLEILDIIVENNNDSLKTLISWAKISLHFKEKIQRTIGIITIIDGMTSPVYYPLDYNILFNHNNNIIINTSEFDSTILQSFMTKKDRILISIHSDEMYSQRLRLVLIEISRHCLLNTVICIIYYSTHNYMSRLYFQTLEKFSSVLTFSELYVYGNRHGCLYEGLFDLVNFFRNSYINDIQNIHSLTIIKGINSITSSSLRNIETLSTRSSEIDIYNILKSCPNITTIGSLKFPTGPIEHYKYILPRTESIFLSDYYPQLHNVMVDGTLINKRLDLSTENCITNPTFTDLYFPNISSLQLHLGNTPYQNIRFENCNFSKLTHLNCDTGIVPWEDVIQSGANIKSISLKLYTTEQINWLNNCPNEVENIEILSTKTNNIPNISFTSYDLLLNRYTYICLTLQTLLNCNILHNVILPSQLEVETFVLKIDDINIIEEMKNTTNYLHYYHLVGSQFDNFQFTLPYAKYLTIQHTNHQHVNLPRRFLNDINTIEEPYLYDNINYYNSMLGVQPLKTNINMGTEQPSRRYSNESINSIKTYRSINRRRSSQMSNSLLEFPHPPYIAELEQKVFKFVFVETIPNILSLDLYTLENIDFSFKNVQQGILPLLKIILSINDACETKEQLTTLIMRAISKVFNFPLMIKFPNIIIERLQLVIDIKSSKIINEQSSKDYLNILEQNITLQYNYVNIVPYSENTTYRYTICVNI
ncbi:similar to Kazachstania africana KAFR_0B05660 hypothetical protein [Maudiozyma barnettii]|nr:similar to Kazachstania africana KAFR_0B05660 hypothetical protein [Kazachstania barnettii]